MAAKYPSDQERLEDVFQDKIIKEFSRIVDFKRFARSQNGLCLDESVIQTIVEDNPNSVEEQKMQMLLQWKEEKGTEATTSNMRFIVKAYKDLDVVKDQVRVSQDCTFQINNPISSRSRVYRGAQQLLSEARKVAVKLVPLNEKNKREANNLSKLSYHQNVVSLIQSGIYKESHLTSHIYIVMEQCRSENLEDFIVRSKSLELSPPDAMKLAMSKQFLLGLSFIHSNDIIHRDIKPSNVLISENGKFIKICDYGLSKSLSQGRSATNLSMVRVGTDGFRSPETYLKDIITKLSDNYSSGLVVHFIVSEGNHAFGKDPDRWNSNIKDNKNRKLSPILTNGRKSMIKLLSQMLEFEEKNRPTADQVLRNKIFVDVSTNLKLDDFILSVKQAIVMIDFNSRHLHSFIPTTKQWGKMQKIDEKMDWLTLLVVEDYIHALTRKTMCRLKYSDPKAVLVELQGKNEDHGVHPPFAVLNGSIYVVGGGDVCDPTRSVEKYENEQWNKETSLNVARKKTCAVVAQDCIYCIGGLNAESVNLRSVEKFDPETKQWSEIEPMLRKTSSSATAVGNDGCIYVADEFRIQCYDIQNRSWKILKPDHWPSRIYRANIHIVNDELYIVFNLPWSEGVEIYNLDRKTMKMTLVCKREDIEMYSTNSIVLNL